MRLAGCTLAVACHLGGCGVAEEAMAGGSSGDASSDASEDDDDAALPNPVADSGESTEGGTSDSSDEADESSGGSTTGEPPPVEPGDCDALLALADSLAEGTSGEAEITDFFRSVSYGEQGFPIIDGDRLCFAYRDPVGVPLSVAGDFNEWVVGEHDLDYASGKHDLRYAVVDLPPRDHTGLYKFVRMRDEPEYFADPASRRFGWDEFGEYSLVAPQASVSHYERWPDFNKNAGGLLARDVVVYVPPGAFEASDLPVLYMHDGQNLFAPNAIFGGWRVGTTMDFAIAEDPDAAALVVGIDNTVDRFEEYTHVADDLGGMLQGGKADQYAAFIVDGIKPLIDERYPTALDAERTAVAGSSLGGLASLYIAWRYPEVFGAAASMSGTVGWGSFGGGNPTIGDLFVGNAPVGQRIYLDSGGGPGLGCPSGGSDNYCDNVALADALRGLGWSDGDDLLYVWEEDAGHNEAEWAERFPAMIRDWFPGNL
ncbi:MAG: alpha/beta hydrolase-fold protein [Myxococcota bacterium]